MDIPGEVSSIQVNLIVYLPVFSLLAALSFFQVKYYTVLAHAFCKFKSKKVIEQKTIQQKKIRRDLDIVP